MKTKIYLCISVGLVLFLLGGLVMTQVTQAQVKMKPTPMPQPANRIVWDYDSGWETITIGSNTFTHNLGGDPGEYFVYVQGRGPYPNYYIHNAYYGACYDNNSNGYFGALWNELTPSEISVLRASSDNLIGDNAWESVRVRILKNQ